MVASPSRKRGTRVHSGRVIWYTRVSTAEQADSGAGLAAQERTLSAITDQRGWTLVGVKTDAGVSGKSVQGRAALGEALDLLGSGGADILAVAKLDRLSRSVLDFVGLVARADREGWSLVAADVQVDTSTPAGRLVSNVMATIAEFERDVTAQRTKDALAARREAGVRLGRPRQIPLTVVDGIRVARARGRTLREIGESLTADGIPTARGGKAWSISTVQGVLNYPSTTEPYECS